MKRIAALLVAGACLIGCASSSQSVETSYNASQNQTTYRTAFNVPIQSSSGGYASQQRKLNVIARASCTGEQCEATQCSMVFSVPGGEDVYVTDRTLTLDVDGDVMEWEDPAAQDQQQAEQVVGRLLQIGMERDRLRRIANASSVTGTIGGIEFRLTSSHKERLASLLAMPQESPSASSPTKPTP